MDLTTFEGIQAAMDHYLMDYGLEPADLSTLVQVGAQETYRRVRTYGMEVYSGVVQLGVDGTISPLPDRYLAMKSFRIHDGSRMRPAIRRQPEWFIGNVPPTTNISLYFCRDGNRFLVGAGEGNDVEYVFYQRPVPFVSAAQATTNQERVAQGAKLPAALLVAQTTNWFTENAGDVLLWAALANSAPFIREDARVPTWQAKWNQGVDALNGENLDEDGSGSALEMGVA